MPTEPMNLPDLPENPLDAARSSTRIEPPLVKKRPRNADKIAEVVREELRQAGIIRNDDPNAPVAIWTPDGIGEIAVAAHSLVFHVYGMRPLDDVEEKGLREDTAYYLNARFPNQAIFEPEARILARLGGLWVPRMADKREQAQAQKESEK